MALIDEVVIKVQSGTGGNGCISFRREKFIPRGGPDGGNGGRGGSVYLEATRDKSSLLDFKFRPKFLAERGEHGMGSDMHGRGGKDLIIPVPMGTLVYDQESGELVIDLTEHGTRFLVAEGGRGGRGNRSFTTSRVRAPRISTPGEEGKIINLKLELRLIADIGLIGLPNAGKSSFLSAVSRARPKIADYPFTTLEPHLGVVDNKEQGFVIADLPGLIEGASEGAGLGHKFLRHVSRNRLLLHLVDFSQTATQIQKAVKVIREELRQYDEDIADREELLVFTKADLLTEAAAEKKISALEKKGLTGILVSSKTRYGIPELLDLLTQRVAESRRKEEENRVSPAEADSFSPSQYTTESSPQL